MRKLFFIVLAVFASSCVKLKDRVYFQDGNFNENTPTVIKNQGQAYKIQPKDILNIDIFAFNQEELEVLRKDLQVGFNGGGGGGGNSGLYLRGYVVDKDGNIFLPGGVGQIPVQDLTLEEVREKIAEVIQAKILKQFIVEVKLLNFNVSVLGEVSKPGTYQIYQEKFTILQGLAMAGDLTDVADRRNVRLLRQRPDGVEVISVDLTKSDIFDSEYFFLHPNDQIYVQPLKAGVKRDNLPVTRTVLSSVSLVIGIVNLIVTITK